jgi:hypothetical protein
MPLPLNIYQTITHVVGVNTVGIYTAPTGYSGVVLLAQAANIGENTHTVSLSHKRTSNAGIAVTTEIVQNLPIPANDSTNLLFGKLILETGDVLQIRADNANNVKFIASILETLN